MSQFDVKMTALADAIKAKNGNVTGKLSIQAMIDAVGEIEPLPSGITVTAADVLASAWFVDNTGTLQQGSIQTVTAQLNGNVFTVAEGYIADPIELTVAEAGDVTVTDNVVNIPTGYISTPRTATVPVAQEPSVSGNVVTLYKGYQSEQKTITVEVPDGYADVSGVTATPNDVLMTARFVDSNGELQEGTIQPVTAHLTDNVFEVEEGFISNTTLTVPEAAAPTINGNEITIHKGYNPQEQTVAVGTSGDCNIQFGYWTEEGKFQEVDLSGDAPVDKGEPITVDAVMFDTGKDSPDYGKDSPDYGTGMEFYECASVNSGESYTGNIIVSGSGDPDGVYTHTTSLPFTDSAWTMTNSMATFYITLWDDCWILWEGYNDDPMIYAQSNNTNPLATAQELCSSTWTDGTFTAEVDTSGPAGTPTWSGYKMVWNEGTGGSGILVTPTQYEFDGEIMEATQFVGEYLPDSNSYGDGFARATGIMSDKLWIQYVTGNHNKWLIWEPSEWGDYFYYSNTTATKDATIAEVCAGPWEAEVHGYHWKPVLNPMGSPAGWVKTDELIEGLEIKGYTPRIGTIYNSDATIEVKRAFDGSGIPIPQDGLVFYAPLQTDYVDQISGKAAAVTGGTFTTHNGLSCLQLDGSEYVKWADNSDLPVGTSACSLVLIASPINQSSWRYYMGIGQPGNGQHMSIAASGGRFMDRSTYLENGIWQTLIITRTSDGSFKDYVDGQLVGTSNRLDDFPMPSCMCVGAAMWDNFSQKANSYVAFAAVYNREITACEVAEIHDALMEGVQQ